MAKATINLAPARDRGLPCRQEPPNGPRELIIQLKVELLESDKQLVIDQAKLRSIARILKADELIVSLSICEAAFLGNWVTVARYKSRDIAQHKHYLLRMQTPFLANVNSHGFRLQEV